MSVDALGCTLQEATDLVGTPLADRGIVDVHQTARTRAGAASIFLPRSDTKLGFRENRSPFEIGFCYSGHAKRPAARLTLPDDRFILSAMTTLYEAIAARVDGWRKQHYPHDQYPAIGEVLEWAANPDVAGFRLRPPQLRALETYWYLRLIENTPHVFDLYKQFFPKKSDLIAAP